MSPKSSVTSSAKSTTVKPTRTDKTDLGNKARIDIPDELTDNKEKINRAKQEVTFDEVETSSIPLQVELNEQRLRAADSVPTTVITLAQASGVSMETAASTATAEMRMTEQSLPKIDWGQTIESNSMGAKLGFNPLWLGTGLLAALAAGSGGTGTNAVSGNTVAAGGSNGALPSIKVIDGPIHDAKVYAVLGSSGTQEVEVGITNGLGEVVLTTKDQAMLKALSTGSATLIAKGGVNDNGLPNTVDLRMSFDKGLTQSSVVTPVTTLISALVALGKSVADANAVVTASLGLPVGTDWSTYDPTSTSGNPAVSLSLLKAGAALSAMASQMSDAEGMFLQLAGQIQSGTGGKSLFTVLQDPVLVQALLVSNGGDLAQLGAIVSANNDMVNAVSMQELSKQQLSGAKPQIELLMDTGLADGITTNADLSFKGVNSGNAGQAIEISQDGGKTWVLASKFQLMSDTVVNSISLLARQKDSPETQTDVPLSFVWVNKQVDSPKISLVENTGSTNDNITSNSHIQLSGYSAPMIQVGVKQFVAKLEYNIGGGEFKPLALDGKGQFDFTRLNNADGKYTLNIRASYPDLGLENTSQMTFTIDKSVEVDPVYQVVPNTVAVTDHDPGDHTINTQTAKTVVISGKTEADATVELHLVPVEADSGAVHLSQTVVADKNGNWQVNLDATQLKTDGHYTPTVTITDVAGNHATKELSDLIVDNLATSTAQLVHQSSNDTGLSADDGITSNTRPWIEGQAEPFANLSVTGIGSDTYTLTADSTGHWSFQVKTSLADGEYTPIIKVTDLTGNVNDGTDGAAFTVDTTAPTEATAHLVHDEVNDTGLQADDGITNNASPTIEGTTEALAFVSVVVGESTYTTTADADGVWSVQAEGLADGEYKPMITVKDVAGNVSVPLEGEAFTVDTTAPDAQTLTGGLVHDSENDTGVYSDDGLTNNSAPLIEGLADALSHIKVDLNGAVFEAQADETGYWSVTADGLGDGEYTPMIRVMDAAGNLSKPIAGETFTVDATAPTEATANLVHDDVNDTGLQADDGITKNTSPTIEGTTEALAFVSVVVGDNTYETQADADGVWSVGVDGLTDGDYTPVITVTDLAGNVSDPIEGGKFTVDVTPPTEASANLVHDEVNDTGVSVDDGLTKNTSPMIEGKAEALALVSVLVGDNTYETQADADGVWSVQTEGLVDGEYRPVITVTDTAGNVSDPIDGELFIVSTVPPDTIGVTGGLVHDAINDTGIDDQDNITKNDSPELQGTANAGYLVSVDVGGNVYTATADTDGIWRVSVDTLDAGKYVPSITVTDLVGNVSDPVEGEAFLIAAPPVSGDVVLLAEDPTANYFLDIFNNADFDAASVVEAYSALGLDIAWSTDTGLSAEDGLTFFPFPKISGIVEAVEGVDVTVLVKVGGHTYVTEAVDGQWSIQVTHALGAVGETHTYIPKILMLDSAGNSTQMNGPELIIDRQAPEFNSEFPEFNSANLVHDDGNDTGYSISDNLTNNLSPTLEGHTEPGSQVFVIVNGTIFSSDPVDESGYWHITIAVTEGEYTPLIRIMDAAGNVSQEITGETFTVDATTPTEATANLVHDDVNDTGVLADDGITSNTSPVIEGTTEALAYVSVAIGDNTYETQADADGVWSVQAEGLADGEYKPVIKVTDAAGNVSESKELSLLLIDTQAPANITADLEHDAVNDTGTFLDDNITANRSPWIGGEGEPGAAVSVKIGTQTLTTSVSEDGAWRVQAVNLTDGTYTALVTMTDAAGNVSDPFEVLPIVIDGTAPELLSAHLVRDDVNDTGASQTDNVTNNRTPMIEGYTAPMAVVQMDLAGIQYEIAADDTGYFNFTPEADLLDAVYTPTFKLQDVAGNVSTVSNGLSFTIDTVPPAVAEFLAPVNLVKGAVANFQPLGQAHTLIAGDLVEDYSGKLPEGLTIDSHFNITGTPLAAGATWLAVTQADAAGNLATSYEQLVVVASVKAPSSSITSMNTNPLTASLYQGTAADDANLTLYKSAGDVWLGMAGNDTFKITSLDGLGFAAIDGGTGTDELKLMVTGMDFNLSNYNNPSASEKSIQHIEAMAIYGTGSNLSVSAKDIYELHSDALDIDHVHHLLRVDNGTLGSGRTVTLSDLSQVGVAKGFNADGSVNAAHTGLYAKYEGSYTDPLGTEHLVSLLVQQGLTTQFVV